MLGLNIADTCRYRSIIIHVAIMPSVVECNFETGENRVLEYVELSDEEFDKQII
jgi:hypothetical protein